MDPSIRIDQLLATNTVQARHAEVQPVPFVSHLGLDETRSGRDEAWTRRGLDEIALKRPSRPEGRTQRVGASCALQGGLRTGSKYVDRK